ncbi:hypothetical protein D3C86_1879010 [compost metagenome]
MDMTTVIKRPLLTRLRFVIFIGNGSVVEGEGHLVLKFCFGAETNYRLLDQVDPLYVL